MSTHLTKDEKEEQKFLKEEAKKPIEEPQSATDAFHEKVDNAMKVVLEALNDQGDLGASYVEAAFQKTLAFAHSKNYKTTGSDFKPFTA